MVLVSTPSLLSLQRHCFSGYIVSHWESKSVINTTPAQSTWSYIPLSCQKIINLLVGVALIEKFQCIGRVLTNRQSQDSSLRTETHYFLGNVSKSLYGTATLSGIALSDTYFEILVRSMIWCLFVF